MNIDLSTDESLRESTFAVRVSHRELRGALDPYKIMVEVRAEIAKRLADLVMEKVGPVIEKAMEGME
jgi:hypothetical protein